MVSHHIWDVMVNFSIARSNLKSVALTVLELLAFNSHQSIVRTHTDRQTDRRSHIERIHYLRHSLRSLGGDNYSSPGDRKRTPGRNWHLQTATGQPVAVAAAGSNRRRNDRPQRREPTATAGCQWRRRGHGLCPGLGDTTTERAHGWCQAWRAVD